MGLSASEMNRETVLALADWVVSWLESQNAPTGSVTINFKNGGVTHVVATASHRPEFCVGRN